MTGASLATWPPTAGEYYLKASSARPVFQGDVFRDVPLVKAKNGGSAARDPNVSVERRMVAVLQYPCDIYTASKLVSAQTIAPVVEAAKVGIPPDWDGAYEYAPLPDLMGDGVAYAVNLRAVANIDASYLRMSERIRCLSQLGWAVFRQRKALCDTRALISLDDLVGIGASTWREVSLWQRWNEAGLPANEFQPWLDEREAAAGGFERRKLLVQRMEGLLRDRLEHTISIRLSVKAAAAAVTSP